MAIDVPQEWSRLATFVQISDLHVGEIDPNTGDAEVTPAWAQAYQKTPLFDGFLGHHGMALQDLEAFCTALRAEGDEFRLIVTGDFTRCGSKAEFGVAMQYLTATVDLSAPNLILTGLGLRQVELVIPGNHDHWGGSLVTWGAGPSLYSRSVPGAIPRVHPPVTLANGRRVIFVGINSDEDVTARSRDRVLARGKFASELGKPTSRPPRPSNPADIRMMLVHHSWDQSGWFLRMRSASKQALAAFLYNHDIRGILTGHSHEPLLRPFTVNTPNGNVDFQELRAGTTTQHDQVPLHWRNLLGTVPSRNWPLNSLLLHRLYDDGHGQTVWASEIYERDQRNGFQVMRGPGSDLTFLA